MAKGKFITIYGINNIGKSTHSKLLVKRLEEQGHKVHYIKYPVYDVEPSGSFIDKILRSDVQRIPEDELQLWYVLNRYQYQPELKRLLDEGYIVVAEDYTGTGIAWGCAKGLDEQWLEIVNKNLIKEDLGILMEGVRDVRAREDVHVHEQNDDLIERCEGIHSHLADKYGWKRVELQEKIEDTAVLIWDIVDDFLR
jgi:dTMP kinase